eukprot:SAG22_NODE_957_length_6316_cov_2.176130_3_plen_80_part_00
MPKVSIWWPCWLSDSSVFSLMSFEATIVIAENCRQQVASVGEGMQRSGKGRQRNCTRTGRRTVQGKAEELYKQEAVTTK